MARQPAGREIHENPCFIGLSSSEPNRLEVRSNREKRGLESVSGPFAILAGSVARPKPL